MLWCVEKIGLLCEGSSFDLLPKKKFPVAVEWAVPPTTVLLTTAFTVGRCSLLLLVPILARTFILVALVLLVSQLDVKITDIGISLCLVRYEPQLELLVVICIGATLTILVSMG